MGKYTKEQRDGFTVKTNSKGRIAHKLPLFCPREQCRRITGTIDDRYLKEYGVCAQCYVDYIEARTHPLIDVEYYKNRLSERGY